jgi:hypothetical protein
MESNDQIHRLTLELNRQSLVPVATISNQALYIMASRLRLLATWLRQTARERPLITLLLAAEAGYAVARIGRQHARR